MSAIDLRLFLGGTDEQVRTGDPLPPLSKVELSLRNYFRLRGRASRSEFWWFTLASMSASALLGALQYETDLPDTMVQLLGLLSWIPSFTVGVRRLHDVDRSGLWFLATLTGVGWLLLLFWWVQPGDAGPNRFTLDIIPAVA